MIFMRRLVLLLVMLFFVIIIAFSILFLQQIMNVDLGDYSLIIWNFAISIVMVVIVTTVLKLRKRKKKKKEKKETKKIDVYYKEEDKYRTEYY